MPSVQPIPPLLGALLGRIVFEGVTHALPALPPIVGGTWGGIELSGLWGPLTVVGSDLEWEVDPVFGVDVDWKLRAIDGFSNESAVFQLADGRKLSVRFGGVTRRGVRPRLGHGRVVELNSWNLEGRAPARWVGNLVGFPSSVGNLKIVKGANDFSRMNVRLEGNYTWYIVSPRGRHEDEHVVVAVVEPRPDGPSSFDRDAIGVDFMALQFAYGTAMQMDTMVAVDEPGNVIGGAGLGFGGERRRALTDGPVPRRGFWEPILFHRLTRAMNTLTLPWGVVCTAYLDSTSDPTIDGRYLRLHVALEGFARALLSDTAQEGRLQKSGTKRLLVKDEKSWKAWLKTHASAVRDLAVDERGYDVLLGKLHQAIQPPSSATVTDTLSRLEPPLAVDDRVLTELRGRNIPAHHGTMNKPNVDYDVERDVERVDILRTLLVAIVSRACGYDGPIVGWDRRATPDWKPVPPWWPAPSPATVAEASVRFASGDRQRPRAHRAPAFGSRIRTRPR